MNNLSFSKKRILVTGGAGFLGSHLVDRLLQEGHHVISLDNLFTGNKLNNQHHSVKPRFEFIYHDVVNPIKIDVDEIYNLACPASPIHYQHDPIKTMKTSVIGALNVLELAKKNNCRVFQASTSEVYGDPHVHPQQENYWGNVNPIGLRSCYDEGKRCAETLFFDYNREHNIDIKLVRIFNTYGPRMSQSDGRVVSNFIAQALQGHPITIYGNGTQTRSFCYVDDLISGFIKLMDSPDGITGPINMGNPNEFTVQELAEKIIFLTKSKSEIIYKELPLDDPKQRQPDISKANETLNWRPEIQLDEGLDRTIAYFCRHLEMSTTYAPHKPL